VRTDDFDYDLPPDRIAQQPADRGTSRMLVWEREHQRVRHGHVADLAGLLEPGDLLLLNDTRVIPARVFATRPTGRRFELLLLEPRGGGSWRAGSWKAGSWEVLLRPSARAREGEVLNVADGGGLVLGKRLGEGAWTVRFDPPLDPERLESLGEAPLPPYISRPQGATRVDRERYQTVYASVPGAVAAPTAGLHLTAEQLDGLEARGVELARLTLHVGLGTFRPVAVDEVAEHRMHAERYAVPEPTARAVNQALAEGRRIVCVGTTTVRALEGGLVAGGGVLVPGEARTDIFITPGYRFCGVGALLTNFHLPRSTLLMMVSALAGREQVLELYRLAVAHAYRFYSYGDAMLIL
jgi:S-adenosylmethionine:tRNA ribosyltransferase-isomerase